jgi:hypothetical protein
VVKSVHVTILIQNLKPSEFTLDPWPPSLQRGDFSLPLPPSIQPTVQPGSNIIT